MFIRGDGIAVYLTSPLHLLAMGVAEAVEPNN